MTLIAAARGESPKLGTSFLEIVKAKHAVVDTEGVGEPLRALVDTMVRPDPNTRPQTAAELLRIVGGGSPAGTSIESLLQENQEEGKRRPGCRSPRTGRDRRRSVLRDGPGKRRRSRPICATANREALRHDPAL